MGDVKILHDYVFDEIKNGKLNLYFPHNLDTKKDPEVVKNMMWMKNSGFRHSVVSKKRTDILYPGGIDVSECFEEREVFNYVSGLNKRKGVKMTKDDFLIFVFSKFLKSSGICEKSYSYIFDYSDNNYSKSKLKYFNTITKLFNNEPDEKIFTNDLKSNVHLFDYVNAKLLRANPDKKIVQLSNSESSKELIELSNKYQVRKVNLPNLNIKGIDGILFEDILNELSVLFGSENYKTYYNAILGAIFSCDLSWEKIELDMSSKDSILKCGGLFITETYIKLLDLGILSLEKNTFNSNILSYHKSKSSWYFNPHILYKSLINHCEIINKVLENSDYDLQKDENVRVYLSGMMEDLSLGMKSLGMFLLEKIDVNI